MGKDNSQCPARGRRLHGAGWAGPPRPVHTRSPQQRELGEIGAGCGRAPQDSRGAPTRTTGPQEPSYQPTPPPLCRATQVAPRNASPTKFCTAMSAEREHGQPPARRPAWARVGGSDGNRGGATAGSADTTFSEPSEAGAPDKCPMPTAACPARAQGQHPRGTDGWRNCRSSDKQHQSHPSEKHASGRGTSCVLRTAPGITGRGPRAGSQIGLCRQTAPAQRWEPSLTTVQGPAERVGAALRPAPRARDKGPGPWWALPQSPRREEEGSWE